MPLPPEIVTIGPFKQIKADLVFKITNNILPVIYWHQLRQKMLAILNQKSEQGGLLEEKKIIDETPGPITHTLVADDTLETKSTPSSRPRKHSNSIKEIHPDHLFEHTKTPEAFLNYFRSFSYPFLEKFIEHFLFELLGQDDDVKKITSKEITAYCALENFFTEISGPQTIGTSQTEKKIEKKQPQVELSKAFVPIEEIDEPILFKIKENLSPLSTIDAPDVLEQTASSIYTDFEQLKRQHSDKLTHALTNQLGFSLNPMALPPTQFNYIDPLAAKYLIALIDESKSTGLYPEELKKMIGKQKFDYQQHLDLLIHLKYEVSTYWIDEKGKENLFKNKNSHYYRSHAELIDFWFPDKLKPHFPTSKKEALALLNAMETVLLLPETLSETSSLSVDPLNVYTHYCKALNSCNSVKNKKIKEALLQLLRKDLVAFKINHDQINPILQLIHTISEKINTFYSIEHDRVSIDPANISVEMEQIIHFCQHNPTAIQYFDHLHFNINEILATPVPRFEASPILNDEDKKIISVSPKTDGTNHGYDVTVEAGRPIETQVYTIKQGSRKRLTGSEISIANTSAEVATFLKLQTVRGLQPRGFSPAYYLIKKSEGEENKSHYTTPVKIKQNIIAGLQKHFYVASEWSTDYLSIKACEIMGYPARMMFAGRQHPEIFEALRELNDACKLGLENVFFGGLYPADFDVHLENFRLIFNINNVHPEVATYALYLISDLKKFIKSHENKVTREVKKEYVQALIKKIKKIQKLEGQVYFQKIDHDSGYFRFCDPDRNINLSDHKTSPIVFKKRWGVISQPTCHLTELLVGKNPELLLLSNKSIEIMKANDIITTLQSTKDAIKKYYRQINKLSESPTLKKYCNNHQQKILYILLDKFYAHLTGELTQLPPEFSATDETKLTAFNKKFKKKILQKILESTLQRSYDIQRQYNALLNKNLTLALIKKKQINLEENRNKYSTYLKFRAFLQKDMLRNRAELLFLKWKCIKKEYTENPRTSDASKGLLMQLDHIYKKIKGGLDENQAQELKKQAYLQTERYLQLNVHTICSLKLAKTILKVTQHTPTTPFYNSQILPQHTSLSEQNKLYNIIAQRLVELEGIAGRHFSSSTVYFNLLDLLAILIKLTKSAPDMRLQGLENFYKKFVMEGPRSEHLEEDLLTLNSKLDPTGEHTKGLPLHTLITNFSTNVKKLPVVQNLKNKILAEKNETINTVLENIKTSYNTRKISFFQSPASRDLFKKLLDEKKEEDENKEAKKDQNLELNPKLTAIIQYLNDPRNRRRKLGKTIIDYTGWTTPDDLPKLSL